MSVTTNFTEAFGSPHQVRSVEAMPVSPTCEAPDEMATPDPYKAAHATLIIPELLEQILLDVPIRELLLNQRVSKTWRAVIEASKSLQIGLFKRSSDTKTEGDSKGKYLLPSSGGWENGVGMAKQCFVNPLLLHIFGAEPLIRHLVAGKTVPPKVMDDTFRRKVAAWVAMEGHAMEPKLQLRMLAPELLVEKIRKWKLDNGYAPLTQQRAENAKALIEGNQSKFVTQFVESMQVPETTADLLAGLAELRAAQKKQED